MAAKTSGLNNKQLALAIQPNDQATLANFCWGVNSLLQQQVQAMLSDNQDRLLYLWGAQGCGKSHLLQACCQAYTGSAMYLPLKLLKDWGAESIADIEAHSLICIDDIQSVSKDIAWEEAIFHLYNRVRDGGQGLLILSGTHPPASMPISLPDLRSRLGAGLIFHLHELADEDKIQVLQQQALHWGFALSSGVAHYLLTRFTRDMHHLYALLKHLDAASLAAHRRITIPFVKEVLGNMMQEQ